MSIHMSNSWNDFIDDLLGKVSGTTSMIIYYDIYMHIIVWYFSIVGVVKKRACNTKIISEKPLTKLQKRLPGSEKERKHDNIDT